MTEPTSHSTTARPPGVLVLGMHRSGTSVVSGMLDRLGLDGGPAETMFQANQFNSDGYWEQRSLVELHDRVLRRLNGFASAPPRKGPADLPAAARDALGQDIRNLLTMFTGPWFVKDPRHCLLVALWDAAVGQGDLAIVVSRNPAGVVNSLHHRNGYPPAVGSALWERYMHDLLGSLAGRSCFFVQYEELLADPAEVAVHLAEIVGDHVGDPRLAASDRSTSAQQLVRPRETASSSRATAVDVTLTSQQRSLWETVQVLSGLHEKFEPPSVPAPAASSTRLLERRRLKLLWVDRLLRTGPDRRAKLDTRHRPPAGDAPC